MAVKTIFEAIGSNQLDLVVQFIKAGTDVNKRHDHQNSVTPLHQAIYHNRGEIAQYLVEQGADLNLIYDSQTVLGYAKKYDRDSLVSYIEFKIAERHPWSLFSPTKLAHVEVSVHLNRKITEIFNMESRDRMIISENLSAKTETILPLTPFDELPKSMVEKITAKFIELGGETSETSIPNKPRYVLEGKKHAATP